MTSARGVTNLIFGAPLPILVLDKESVYSFGAVAEGLTRLVTPAKEEVRK
jgi:hypothetical protein